jgi:23S rRNA pseudouridine2605 synthase
VNRLIRVSFGPFQLGELEEGKIEEVKMRVLREQLGRKIAAQAGVDFDAPVAVREEASPERKGKPRHPEARAAEGREPRRMHGADRGRSSFEGRRRRPPQDDGERQKRSAPQEESERPPKPRPWRGRNREAPIPERELDADKPRTVKAGLLTDRKGRRVLVQRVQPEPSEPQEPPPRQERQSRGRPRGKSPRDRRSGPRPARPRSAGEGKRR